MGEGEDGCAEPPHSNGCPQSVAFMLVYGHARRLRPYCWIDLDKCVGAGLRRLERMHTECYLAPLPLSEKLAESREPRDGRECNSRAAPDIPLAYGLGDDGLNQTIVRHTVVEIESRIGSVFVRAKRAVTSELWFPVDRPDDIPRQFMGVEQPAEAVGQLALGGGTEHSPHRAFWVPKSEVESDADGRLAGPQS